MRHSLLKIGSFLATVLGVGAALAQTLNTQGFITPRTRALINGNTAYLTGPSEVITEMADIQQVLPSPDKGAVLVVGSKARPYRGIGLATDNASLQLIQRFPEVNVVYWDTRTRTPQTLFRESMNTGHLVSIRSLDWFPQSRTALMTVSRAESEDAPPTRTLMRINTATGAVTRLMELPPASVVSVSPTEPLAFVFVASSPTGLGRFDEPYSLRVYTPEGLRNTIPMGPNVMSALNWTRDGRSLYSTTRTVQTVDGKRVQHSLYNVLDLKTGAITHPEKLPATPDNDMLPGEAANWQVGYTASKTPLSDSTGQTQMVTALWLHVAGASIAKTDTTAKPAPSASAALTVMLATDSLLIATNAQPQALLFGRNNAAALFVRDGTLCATPIFRMTVDEFTHNLRQVQRISTMSNAKQVGLGILQYSMDYDEQLPQLGTSVADNILPYVKSPVLFNNPASGEPGFVYSYKGNAALGQVERPAETQMGYISGAGGRAIIWVDGHVTWEDAP